MMANKKRLKEEQEFQVMLLVLDKFLWLGFGVMVFGLYKMLSATIGDGIYYIITGAVLLLLFMILIVKEYEIVK